MRWRITKGSCRLSVVENYRLGKDEEEGIKSADDRMRENGYTLLRREALSHDGICRCGKNTNTYFPCIYDCMNNTDAIFHARLDAFFGGGGLVHGKNQVHTYCSRTRT